MKKLVSLILALITVLTLSSGVMAASSITTEGGTDSTAVNGKYIAGAPVLTVYSIDVEWGAMQFNYTDKYIGDWNADLHKYENAVPAAWAPVAGTNKLTVTNHSNTDVNISLSSALDAGITGEFKIDSANARHLTYIGTNEFDLKSAEVATDNIADAPMCSTEFNITSGKLGADKAADFAKIGTLTVTISKANE